MKDYTALRTRYQRDSAAVQLGGLASNLSRLAWYAQRAEAAPVATLFRESKYFTEWAAPACSEERQVLLADVQRQLALWERGWGTRLDPAVIAHEAQRWSTKLLQAAGLVDR